MDSIAGKAIVIMGAAGTGNMGQAMARSFVTAGARVLVAGRNDSVLRGLPVKLALCGGAAISQANPT